MSASLNLPRRDSFRATAGHQILREGSLSARRGPAQDREEAVQALTSLTPPAPSEGRAAPTSERLRILVAEDEASIREILASEFARLGFEVELAGDGVQAEGIVRERDFDVVLLDLCLPGRNGLEVLKSMRSDGHEAEAVVLTGYADTESAIQALKLQAYDYLTKPVRLEEVVEVVGRAAERRRLRRENRSLRRAISQSVPDTFLVGESRALETFKALLDRAALSDSNVLILGESGSGKELAARYIHRRSRRRDRPFLAMNCGALPDELLESELFGHEKGAFTGATARRHGLLELAHTGMLFFDEVEEMSAAMQVKLLRALDLGEIRRLGSGRTMRVDLRVLAASNKDISAELEAGRFRPDLYYRLGVIILRVPPLRERVQDIPALVDHFVQLLTPPGHRPVRFARDAMAELAQHPWPGNVRELKNLVERFVVLSDREEISAGDVGLYLSVAPTSVASAEAFLPLKEVERRYIAKVLHRTAGNRAEAARILGVDPKTLYNKLKAARQIEA